MDAAAGPRLGKARRGAVRCSRPRVVAEGVMSRSKLAALGALVLLAAGCQRGCGDEPAPPAAEPPAPAAAIPDPSAVPPPGSVPIEVLQAAAEQKPDDPGVRQQLALGLVQAQRTGDAVAEFEKNVLVLKLRAARERKRARGERVEGVKPYGFSLSNRRSWTE